MDFSWLVGYGVGVFDEPYYEIPFPGEWRFEAACRDTDVDLFYPRSGVRPVEALALCSVCPVKVTCLEYALEHHIHWGVWGGMTERQRFTYKRERRVK